MEKQRLFAVQLPSADGSFAVTQDGLERNLEIPFVVFDRSEAEDYAQVLNENTGDACHVVVELFPVEEIDRRRTRFFRFDMTGDARNDEDYLAYFYEQVEKYGGESSRSHSDLYQLELSATFPSEKLAKEFDTSEFVKSRNQKTAK